MATSAVLLKIVLTNIKFELALFAIFQYGYQRGTFKNCAD